MKHSNGTLNEGGSGMATRSIGLNAIDSDELNSNDNTDQYRPSDIGDNWQVYVILTISEIKHKLQ